jgi:hypothetical protein
LISASTKASASSTVLYRAKEARVLDVTVVGIFSGYTVGEFVEVRFTGEDSTGGIDGADESGVSRGFGAYFGQKRGAGVGRKASDIEEVFGEVGYAGERGTGGGAGEVGDELGFRGKQCEYGALLRG